MTREKTISARIRLAAPHHNTRLFRNMVGQYKIDDRWIKYGLGKGSPDLVGWKTVEIVPEMVGQRIAVFVGIEVKATGETPRRNQKAWIKAITGACGLAGVVRDVEEAEAYLSDRHFYSERGALPLTES